MSEDKGKRLREKFVRYAQNLRKKDNELAEKIIRHVDQLVEWYLKNDRDITLQEFHEIVDKE